MEITVLSVLIVICLVSMGINIYSILQIMLLSKLIEHKILADVHGYEDVTPFDAERAQQQEEFNERIAQIKDELAKQQAQYERESTVADETHPLVHNLPHDTIKHTSRVPDVEYAD